MSRHLVFIQDHLHGGGAEQITVDVASGLAQRGYRVTLALLDATNQRVQVPHGVNVVDLAINPAFMKGGIKRNKLKSLSVVERHRFTSTILELAPYQIILGHSHAFWLAPLLTQPAFFWIHGDSIGLVLHKSWNPIKQLEYLKKFYQSRKACHYLFQGHRAIVVNEQIAQHIHQYVDASMPVFPVHNGIDQLRLYQKSLFTSQSTSWDCIFVGRFTPEKQPLLALKLFAKSQLTGRMAMLGDGILFEQAKRYAQQLKIDHRVDFLGWQDNPTPFVNRSKLLISTSKTEGSPLTLAESLLLDTPVVTFNCSQGVEWQFSSGKLKQGLIPLGDEKAFIQAINHIYHSPYPISTEDKQRLSLERMLNEFEAAITTY